MDLKIDHGPFDFFKDKLFLLSRIMNFERKSLKDFKNSGYFCEKQVVRTFFNVMTKTRGSLKKFSRTSD